MPSSEPSVKAVFDHVLEIDSPADRQAYLDAECIGAPEVRQKVEALLRAYADAGSFLEPPSPGLSGVTADFDLNGATGAFADTPNGQKHSSSVALGAVIGGRYSLMDVIGEGGMGSVYLASQTEPVKRQVALKLIKTGMDSKAVLARFDAERQALAVMDHPNIARIYDGGVTPTGQPFFVMELVRGVPLTDYCDRQRLSVAARLELFVSVCQAVQHAHQKGIIHRDLKPGNVLVSEVDGRPTPKIIDFGVAKATEQRLTDLSFPDVGAIVGTPAYMSPEQADPSSMDIDTRTDVYALGVMLYELLTGSPPIDSNQFKQGAILEMLRMVREVEPPRPSTKLSTSDALPNIASNRSIEPSRLPKLLQGELDWVVMKAIEKDRTRRYETANGLARDIERYLADEVVEARPPSTSYRLRKFVRRNKGRAIAASLVMLALLAGMLGTSIGLIRAQEQRRIAVAAQEAEADRAKGERQAKLEAEREAQKARKQAEIAEAVRAFLERDLIAQANPLDPGDSDQKPDPDLKLKTALDRAVLQIAKRFAGKPFIEASIRRAIGQAYAGRGLYPEAQEQQEKACELYRAELANADPADVEFLVRGPYIEALIQLINLYSAQRKTQQVLATIRTLEDQVRQSVDGHPEAQAILETMAGVRDVLDGGDPIQTMKRNQELLRKMFGTRALEHSPNGQTAEMKAQEKKIQAAEANVLAGLQQIEDFTAAMKLMAEGRYPEAERDLTKLIEYRREKGGSEVLIWTCVLAEVYRLQGKYSEARANFETSRDGIRKVLGEDHPSLAGCRFGLALTLLAEKKYEQAETESRAALAFFERRMPNDLNRFELKSVIGAALTGQKKFAAAEPLLLAGYEGFKQHEKTSPAIGSTWLPGAADRLIEFYTATNKPDEVKKWRAERAKYPAEQAPAPHEKK